MRYGERGLEHFAQNVPIVKVAYEQPVVEPQELQT
jgi:hypothetical protein